jgi:hypothetical protein
MNNELWNILNGVNQDTGHTITETGQEMKEHQKPTLITCLHVGI